MKMTVLVRSPGLDVVAVVVSDDPCVVDVVGPGVGPGPVPSHPTQIANIPSTINLISYFYS